MKSVSEETDAYSALRNLLNVTLGHFEKSWRGMIRVKGHVTRFEWWSLADEGVSLLLRIPWATRITNFSLGQRSSPPQNFVCRGDKAEKYNKDKPSTIVIHLHAGKWLLGSRRRITAGRCRRKIVVDMRRYYSFMRTTAITSIRWLLARAQGWPIHVTTEAVGGVCRALLSRIERFCITEQALKLLKSWIVDNKPIILSQILSGSVPQSFAAAGTGHESSAKLGLFRTVMQWWQKRKWSKPSYLTSQTFSGYGCYPVFFKRFENMDCRHCRSTYDILSIKPRGEEGISSGINRN